MHTTMNGLANSGKKWYEEYPKKEAPCKHSKSDVDVLNLKDEAKKYLDAETNLFHLKQSKLKDSETAWLRTALIQGTSSDKVAASIVFIQDNPKYNLSKLGSLVSQVRASKHNQCDLIVTSLRDLFVSEILHPCHKLLKFEEQNLDEIDESHIGETVTKTNSPRNKLLAHWYFEDQLKEHYERFVTALATVATDTVETVREKAISVMTDLLIGNAEQEHKLLESIINKIGDPNSKVASKAIFCLNRLLHEHPNMKIVVMKEVEKLLFRKNIAQRAQYYAICLLTQFVLNKGDGELAASLIELYFAFFKACLKKGEPDSRMMAAILTGVNRAYRFAQTDSAILREHIDSVYKVVHLGSFNVSLNALTLLQQVVGKDKVESNRFYSTFYRKLLDPQIGVSNKRAMFLNLLHRVLQNDPSILRLYAFIKRILQVALYFPANMTCAILYLVSKVLQSRKDLKKVMLRPTGTIKNESEDYKNEISLKNFLEDTENQTKQEQSSIVLTNVVSVPDEDKEKDIVAESQIKIEDEKPVYDPFCRNPLYASAKKSFPAELLALSQHTHPSVALFANTIIEGKAINYTGDPLEDLTLIRFLDRYVFKNPKKLESKKVNKKNDPLALRAGYAAKGIRSLPVDSAAYLNEREERIPVDELYLYRYLKQKDESPRFSDARDDDNDSVNSEEFNDMLDKLAKRKDSEDFDIAGNIKTVGKKKSKGDEGDTLKDDESDHSQDSESLEDFQEGDDDSEDELEDLSDADLGEIDDEDLSDIDFNVSSDEADEDDRHTANKHVGKARGATKRKKIKKTKSLDENVFVSAEKFAEMLEEQSRAKIKHGSSNVLSSIDGASSKQIDWEEKRNQKLQGSFGRRKRQGGRPLKNNKIKKFKQ